MKNALILLAGGEGQRFDKSVPKQFFKVGNCNFIEYFLRNLDPNIFSIICIVLKKTYKNKYLLNLKKDFPNHKLNFSNAGANRQESSMNGILSLNKYKPSKVLIHDAARPLVSNQLIKKIINNLDKNFACCPYVVHNDLTKDLNKKFDTYNNKIINIQTPQGFKFKNIFNAHKLKKNKNYRDDSSLLESAGFKIKFIKGEKSNFKITIKEDLYLFKKFSKKEFRSGIGYDIHKIDKNSKKSLILCGVKFKSYPSLLGHSDADVGYHAICDSILGALSMRDMGYYFKNTDKKWKNANSKIFMIFCNKHLTLEKFKIVNLDVNFICQRPNINKHVTQMKKNISKLLNISSKRISIKATTNEKIGLIGNGEGIAAESIIQICNE